MLYKAAMAKAHKTPVRRPTPKKPAGAKFPITLRLDEASFRKLELLAKAENRTPTNFVETAVLRDVEAKYEIARVITMYVAPEAETVTPGPLLRSDGESDERYAERSALMKRLFAIPDAD
jgi:hypothetical protein